MHFHISGRNGKSSCSRRPPKGPHDLHNDPYGAHYLHMKEGRKEVTPHSFRPDIDADSSFARAWPIKAMSFLPAIGNDLTGFGSEPEGDSLKENHRGWFDL